MTTLKSSGIQLRPDQYVYPPRAESCIPRNAENGGEHDFLANDPNWVAQLKYNDSRLVIKYDAPNTSRGAGVQLWNRHGALLRSYVPTQELQNELLELQDTLGIDLNKTTLLDGGLLHSKHAAIKHTVVIWDVLALNDEYLLGTTYGDRYKYLLGCVHPNTNSPAPCPAPCPARWRYKQFDFGYKISNNILLPQCAPHTNWDACWDLVDAVNAPFEKQQKGPLLEGLVYKNLTGKLEFGFSAKNNASWQIRSRVETGRHLF